MPDTPRVITLSPQDYDAILVDLDGVLTKTARVQAAAWKRLFDPFLGQRSAGCCLSWPWSACSPWGMALIAPNLSALISTRGGSRAGTALGAQNATNRLGQASGPLVGGALFGLWTM